MDKVEITGCAFLRRSVISLIEHSARRGYSITPFSLLLFLFRVNSRRIPHAMLYRLDPPLQSTHLGDQALTIFRPKPLVKLREC